MKKFIFILFTAIASMSLSSSTLAALPDSSLVRYAVYGNTISYFNRDSVYLYDINTKKSELIGSNSDSRGFGGLTVLSDGVYWIENTAGPAIKKYSFSNKSVSTVATIGDLGELEKVCAVTIFQMLTPNQFYYYLESNNEIAPGSAGQPCLSGGSKIYDLNKNSFVDNKSLFAVTGDESKVTSSNLISSYYFKSGLDGKSVWGVYSGYKPGATSASPENAVEYYRVKNFTTDTTVSVPFAKVNSTDLRYSPDSNLFASVLVNPTQGRAIMARQSEKASQYFVYNTNSNSLEKELGKNFSYADGGKDGLIPAASNLLNILSANLNKKEMYYYDAVANATCTVSANSFNTVNDFLGSMDSSIKLIHSGQILKFSPNTSNVVVQPICSGTTTPPAPTTPKQAPPAQNIPAATQLSPGALIKATNNPSVYYYGADGKRYVFYNEDIFKGWYSNFSGLKTISPGQMASIKIGGNVTYRPGTLIKISSDPAVYSVDKGGVLRALASENVARDLYGLTWTKQIKTVPDFLFANYSVGETITKVSDFSPSSVRAWVTDINTDKSL